MQENLLDDLVTIVDAIYQTADRDALYNTTIEGCRRLGFDSFLLFCHKTSKQDMILDATMTNFPHQFLSDYEHSNWSDDDFILDRMLETGRPTPWNTSRMRYENTGRRQSYIDFIHASQLRSGVVVPLMHRPASASAFALSSERDMSPPSAVAQAAHILGTAVMTKAELLGMCDVASKEATPATQSLTAIQHEILDWIAEGKSNLDIATIVGLKPRTVRYHVGEILRKFGVATRTQAVTILRSAGVGTIA